MRRGEVLGLRWGDIDLASGRVRVQRAAQRVDGVTTFVDPKTDRARRQVTLPNFVLERLRRHKAEQAHRRLLIGSAWHDHDLVSDHGDGSALSPDGCTQRFKRIAKEAGMS